MARFGSKTLAFTAALLASTAFSAPHAQAQSIYGFGDSLVDNGNLFRNYFGGNQGLFATVATSGNVAFGVNPVPTAGYYQGRFSNGPTFIEYLPGLTGFSEPANYNNAYGGAFSGSGNLDQAAAPPGVTLPGLTQEIAAFQQAGGHFGANDVVITWVGANDFFAAFGTITPTTSQTAIGALIQATTTQVTTNLTTAATDYVALGARRLVFLDLPNLAATPQFNGTISPFTQLLQPVAAAATTNYDSALPGTIAQIQAQTGAKVTLVSANAILNEVQANPSRFGFTNITNACVFTPSCVSAPVATQNTYLYWDTVHPTTAAHALLAQYVAAAINGTTTTNLAPQVSLATARSFTDSLVDRASARRAGVGGLAVDPSFDLASHQLASLNGLDSYGPTGRPSDKPLAVFLTGGYDFGARDAAGDTSGFTYDSGNIIGGLDYRLGDNLLIGAAFGYSIQHANAASAATTIDDNVFTVGGYASFFKPDYFIDLTGSVGFVTDTDISRPGALNGDRLHGRPDGRSISASLDGGYLFREDEFVFGPIASLTYLRAQLGEYTETGDAALTQTVATQYTHTFLGDIGGQVSAVTDLAGFTIRPRAQAELEYDFEGQGFASTSYLTSEPLVPIYSSTSTGQRVYGVVGAGAAATVDAQTALSVDFKTTVGRDRGDDRSAIGSVKFAF